MVMIMGNFQKLWHAVNVNCCKFQHKLISEQSNKRNPSAKDSCSSRVMSMCLSIRGPHNSSKIHGDWRDTTSSTHYHYLGQPKNKGAISKVP